jgi:hypothetical protein
MLVHQSYGIISIIDAVYFADAFRIFNKIVLFRAIKSRKENTALVHGQLNCSCIVRIVFEIINEKNSALILTQNEKFFIQKQTQSNIEQNKKE